MPKSLKYNALYFAFAFFAFIEVLAANSLTISDLEGRLSEIDHELKLLPSRPAYPVGGVRGLKWSKECESPWVELHFPKAVTLDSLVLVPLATFGAGKVESYGMSPKIKIMLFSSGEVVYEGSTVEQCREAHPFYLKFIGGKEKVSGVRIELLSKECEAPYLAIGEIFAFSNDLNFALNSKVTGNSDFKYNEVANHPDNLVNGQSSLGQPILKKEKQDTMHGYSMINIEKAKESYLEFMFQKESVVHEVRLFSHYAPVNEMLLDQYGHGFPSSFRLVSVNASGEILHTLHEGPFYNPGRNMVSFGASEHEASGIRLYIDELYQKQYLKRKSFALSEVQILSDKNENLAPKSQFKLVGIETLKKSDSLPSGASLTDGQTPKGLILDLHAWLIKLSERNQLIIERNSLLDLQGYYLNKRTFWFRFILGLFFLAIMVSVYIWYRTKEKQKLSLGLVRKDIANDLHDEIGSNLASIRLMMARLKDEKVVGTVREILDESEEAVREMVWALSPQQMNLIEKLRESTSRLLTEHEVDFEVQSSEAWEGLHIKDRQHVVFWFKEALNNIQKHAEATQVTIMLSGYESGTLSMLIKDNGKGMDLEPFKNDYDHLARLKARALKLSGEFHVHSSPDHGCEVSLTFKSNQQK